MQPFISYIQVGFICLHDDVIKWKPACLISFMVLLKWLEIAGNLSVHFKWRYMVKQISKSSIAIEIIQEKIYDLIIVTGDVLTVMAFQIPYMHGARTWTIKNPLSPIIR